MDKNVILFSEMIPDQEWEDKFNNWYDTEHIPIRMNLDGFQRARRYQEIGDSKYLAVYEMENMKALKSQEYMEIKKNPSELTKWMLSSIEGFSRYIGEIISEQTNEHNLNTDPYEAPILYAVMFEVPEEKEEIFNDWYTNDHVPLLLKNKDWLACKRYKIKDGEPGKWTHLALHYLNNIEVLESKERENARNTPYRDKLAGESWFKGTYLLFKHINTFHPNNT